MMRFVQTLWRWFASGEEYAAILALFISLGLVTLAIATRIAIQWESPAWEELARFASVWMYLIGVIVATKEDSHLKMGFLEARIQSIRAKLAMEITNHFVMLLILCIGFPFMAVSRVPVSVFHGLADHVAPFAGKK